MAADAPSPDTSQADAVSGSRAQDRSWTPSFALLGGATIQQHSSTGESICFVGGPGDPDLGLAACDFLVPANGLSALRTPTSGTDYAVSPMIGTNFQLMTPSFEKLPGRPRFFVSGEVTFTFGSTRNIAIEGNPTGVTLPDTVVRPQDTPTQLLNGVGSRTSSEIDTFGYGAGVGVAFPFEFRGRKLWLKPSFVWTRYEINVEGLVIAGLKDDPVPVPLVNVWGSQIREITLSGRESRVYDGIGPGLELELEAGRLGPLGINLFGNINTYRILGDRTIEFSDRVIKPPLRPRSPPGNVNGLPADRYEADWSFSTSPWLFRGAVGIRFQWLGR